MAHGQAPATCSGNQARNQHTIPGLTDYMPPGLHLQVNVEAITNAYSTNQAADIINGIMSWSNVNGLQLQFGPFQPGVGVLIVAPGTGFSSIEHGSPIVGAYPPGGAAVPPNQITGGILYFQLDYQIPNCANAGGGPCPMYDAQQQNADSFLQGTASHGMAHVLGLDDTIDSGSPCTQTSDSVMGGACGTNNNGDGQNPPAPTALSPTPCDRQQINSLNTNPSPGGGGGGGGGGDTGGGNNDGSDYCWNYQDWNDGTNTLTDFSGCGPSGPMDNSN